MKIRTASVVAVIVAAVLILSGIIVCAVGSAAAKSSGVMIYPEDENGNSVYKYDFTEKNITKISVSVKDSDITVTHGGTSSYIEIRNFNANYYKLSTENNILSFSEIDNVASMFKFWEGGFSFKGMRYLFRFGDGGRGMKTVTVNIADTSMLKTVSVSEESGSFSLCGADVSADYILSLGKASADISGLSTTSVLSVSSSAGASMKISDCRAKEFSLSGGGGNFSLSGISADKTIICIYIINGLLAALTGLLYMARLNAADPGISGNFTLDSIAASLIGGNSFVGGEGSVANAAVGALIIVFLRNGMNILGVATTWQQAAIGFVILASLGLEAATRKLAAVKN